MRLNRDFQELLECFAQHEVRYLIVGGWALAAHGVPRLTKDLDVWVWPEPGNAERVVAALEEFGFGELGLCADDFLADDTVIQLGYPPNRVDLLTTPSGVEFGPCWEDRLEITLDGLPVAFIGVEGLVANKRATGRLQDLADVESLEQG
ncbi:MAG: DUF6036 family nucleotidyltransferase [Actinomycetota bacterium]